MWRDICLEYYPLSFEMTACIWVSWRELACPFIFCSLCVYRDVHCVPAPKGLFITWIRTAGQLFVCACVCAHGFVCTCLCMCVCAWVRVYVFVHVCRCIWPARPDGDVSVFRTLEWHSGSPPKLTSHSQNEAWHEAHTHTHTQKVTNTDRMSRAFKIRKTADKDI